MQMAHCVPDYFSPIRRVLGWVILVCAVLLPWFSTPVTALNPRKAITQYIHRTWSKDQGLPSNAILSLLQTRDHYLWIGTYDGLVRFDGASFTVFNKTNTPQMKNNGIWALAEDAEGTLWIGTNGGGLMAYRAGEWRTYDTNQGLLSQIVTTLQTDATGNLWIGTRLGVQCLSRKGTLRLETIVTSDGQPFGSIYKIVTAPDGTVFIASDSGLHRVTPGAAKLVGERINWVAGMVRALAFDHTGTLWIGHTGGTLMRVSGEQREVIKLSDRPFHSTITAICEDFDGNLWLATDGLGVARYHDGQLSFFSTTDGLTDNSIQSMVVDQEGNLWIGAYRAGLNCLHDGKFWLYTPKEGLLDETVWQIYPDSGVGVWICTQNGLNLWRDGHLTPFPMGEKDQGAIVRCVARDRKGRLWVGTNETGLFEVKIRGDKAEYLPFSAHPLPNRKIRALCADTLGNLWIGTSNGLCCLSDQGWRVYTTNDGLSVGSIMAIEADPNGGLWIATNGGGVNYFSNGTFKSYTSRTGLPSDVVFSTFIEPPGTVWITTNNGLVRLKNNQLDILGAKHGLWGENYYAIQPDSLGNFWIGGNSGIFSVSSQELNEVADHQRDRVSIKQYGKADGMPNEECTGSGQGCQTADGRLWFPTLGGVVVVDPLNVPINQLQPEVHLEAILASGKPVSLQLPINLSFQENTLEIKYTALSFVAPEKVQFRVQLVGFDPQLIDPGNRRTAYYTNLPSGHYTFRVLASNNDGVWNETGATLKLSIATPYWRTWWALIGYVLALIGMIGLVVQWRVRALHQQNLILENRIAERTGELSETVKHLQSSEQKALEASQAKSAFLANMSHEIRTPMNGVLGMASLLLKSGVTNEQKEYAETIKISAEALITVINDILDISKIEAGKLKLDVVDFELRPLLEEVIRLFQPVATKKEIDLTLEVAPEVPNWLKGDPVRLRQILNNLVGNAVKFTEQGSVTLSVQLEEYSGGDKYLLLFEIDDTGIGITPEAQIHLFEKFYQADTSITRQYGGTGLGLAISKQLVELMQGEISLVSEAGRGTNFTFSARFQAGAIPITHLRSEFPPQPKPIGITSLIEKVLVVEDNRLNQKVIVSLLKKLGIEADVANNGQEALDAIQHDSYQLIFMDCQMPVMDGFTATREIRRKETGSQHLPIIAVTANAMPEDEQACYEAGMDGVITKPFTPEKLKDAVDAWSQMVRASSEVANSE
ncbi:MAG: response regulator [Acidobacteria bacterium]|nr:response regulator [Acidobacteriota bacterium]